MPARQKKEDVSWFRQHEFSISFLFFLVILAIISIIIFIQHTPKQGIQTCGDGSFYNSCSITKPYYCDNNGSLTEKASVCSCDANEQTSGNSCINDFQTKPKTISLSYILDGKENSINFTAYKGMSTYLSTLPQVISYSGNEKPLVSDFIFNKINQQEQRQLLLPLVIAIQNMTSDKTEQARIAISIVQNIPYAGSNKTTSFFGTQVNYSRYPYQVLYDDQGICGEKSELLVFLLSDLGYGTSIFYFPQENHEAVGIKCPIEESYKKRGYCFVETTGPAIIQRQLSICWRNNI